MAEQPGANPPSPFLVGVCAWLVPGLGYVLLGQRVRGITVCISILLLFILGILIGGIRVVDPPGYGQYGYKVQLAERISHRANGPEPQYVRIDPTSPEDEMHPRLEANNDYTDHYVGWALTAGFLGEISNKPWYIGQILCGPASLGTSSLAIHAAHPASDGNGKAVRVNNVPLEGVPASHSRSWEIGTLYTAVAGMLNLLAIIDSAYRAGVPEEEK